MRMFKHAQERKKNNNRASKHIESMKNKIHEKMRNIQYQRFTKKDSAIDIPPMP